jgi:hypothetical protein
MRKLIAVAALGVFVLAGCQDSPTVPLNPDVDPLLAAEFGSPRNNDYPVSHQGIDPTEHPGNFVSSDDDQVCYDMSALGYIGEVMGDMFGFKIDPPVNYDDGYVEVILSGDMRYLAWEATNATVLAFILKGGPNYHVYDYVESGIDADSWLASPLNRRGNIPEISHYNVCYQRDVPDVGQGCTIGYWRNHADRWPISPTLDFDDTFGVDLFNPDITLGTAIWLGGGDINNLARQATAALLNAWAATEGTNVDPDQFVAFPLTPQQVIDLVQQAVTDGTIAATAEYLDGLNNGGCPLGGTRACNPNYPAACLP